MQAKITSLLVVAILVLVVGALYRVVQNGIRGLGQAIRAKRYVRSSADQPGTEPDTVLGWLLAILVMVLAMVGLTGLVLHILKMVWL